MARSIGSVKHGMSQPLADFFTAGLKLNFSSTAGQTCCKTHAASSKSIASFFCFYVGKMEVTIAGQNTAILSSYLTYQKNTFYPQFWQIYERASAEGFATPQSGSLRSRSSSENESIVSNSPLNLMCGWAVALLNSK